MLTPGLAAPASDALKERSCQPTREVNEMNSAEPVVLYERRDDIALITLNRPAKLNAISAALNHFLG